MRLITREDQGYEQVVFAEVLLPDTTNTYGDFMTRAGVREMAYAFMRMGYGIDVNHDNVDVSGAVYVVESFIARVGDPDFIEGAWVVGMHIEDAAIWAQVLAGTINGYSYEALVYMLTVELLVEDVSSAQGTTEPDLTDGHTHTFFVQFSADRNIVTGGTTTDNEHSHTISHHTSTDASNEHSHVFNIITGEGGN